MGSPTMPDDIGDPEASFIGRLVESGLLQKLIVPLVAAVVGSVSSVATRTVGDAQHEATVQDNRSQIKLIEARAVAVELKAAAIEAEYADFKRKYYERLKENRDRADSEHAILEREQMAAEKYLERRLTRIEYRLKMDPPPMR
jgi:uncharacterized membrane-anchored protein